MPATVEHYTEVVEAFPDTESLTVLVVASSTRERVAGALEVDLAATAPEGWPEDDDLTAWALLEVDGGVLAVECTGFGDPSVEALVALSAGGGSAVTRCNILAHERFGCARDGQLLFDDNEYRYTEDLEAVPEELRSLAALVHDDLESDDDEDDGDGEDAFAVGLAMCEVVTGVALTPGHVEAVLASGFHPAPRGRYLGT